MHPILGYRQFNNEFDISPGGVGSVGQTAVQQRYKTSAPDMPVTIESDLASGSNITDGNNPSMYTLGPAARVAESGWAYRKSWVTSRGMTIEDCRGMDRLKEPLLGVTNQYDWQNKVGQAFKMTGRNFLPLPGGFAPRVGDQLRARQPQVINIAQANPQIVDWGKIAAASLR